VPTAPSWTELRTGARDLRALLAFRRRGPSPTARRRLLVAAVALLATTVAMVSYAAWLPGLVREHPGRVLALLPSGMAGFLALAVLGAVASGGGREVVPREELVAFPVSTITQHLGATLMAPLNIAWLLQAWLLLGATAYALGPHRLLPTLVPVLLWIVAATVAGQLVGWLVEGLRRTDRGVVAVRVLTGLLAGGLMALVVTGSVTKVLDHSPTVEVLLTSTAAGAGDWVRWGLGLAALVALTLLLGYAGCLAADWALGRPEREELRLESGRRRPRPQRRSVLAAMMRVDRAGVWRSVPLRRGLAVLAVLPGTIALAGDLEWQTLTMLPGLVVSGGALLFGVNAWCLDGRGAVWRDSLPHRVETAFWARALVLSEVLLVAAATTSVLAVLRAGRPTGGELAALVCTTLVVTAQVVGGCLRWSVHRPFPSDMRSARATPAPPVVMVGYSARLALTTTVTALLFGALALQPDWRLPVLCAVPMLSWSTYRLVGTARAWSVPEVRAGVVRAVAG
jgi:hypothetical protein